MGEQVVENHQETMTVMVVVVVDHGTEEVQGPVLQVKDMMEAKGITPETLLLHLEEEVEEEPVQLEVQQHPVLLV